MNDKEFLRFMRKGGWKRAGGNMDNLMRRLLNLADRADGKKDNVVSARVGILKAEIKPGPDGKLGTADDEVTIKRAKRKSPAKKKAPAKKASAKKASAKKKAPAKKK